MSYGIWHDDAMLEEHKDLHGAMRRSRELAQEQQKWVEVRTEEGVVLSVTGPEERGSTLHMAKARRRNFGLQSGTEIDTKVGRLCHACGRPGTKRKQMSAKSIRYFCEVHADGTR